MEEVCPSHPSRPSLQKNRPQSLVKGEMNMSSTSQEFETSLAYNDIPSSSSSASSNPAGGPVGIGRMNARHVK